MSYHDEAFVRLKKSNPAIITKFELRYQLGIQKLQNAIHLFRLMSYEETQSWKNLSTPGATGINPTLIKRVFNPNASQYARKWFTFDRPYRFNRQIINQRSNNNRGIQNTREGQEFLLVIPLSHSVKNTIIKKLLPDISLQGFLPAEMLKNSSRCKTEGGTVTLGLPLAVLERIARNLTIEKLGGRLVQQ